MMECPPAPHVWQPFCDDFTDISGCFLTKMNRTPEECIFVCDFDDIVSPPGILRRTFVRWQRRRDETLIMRLKYARAESHDRHVTLSRAFQAWGGFMQLMLRKQVSFSLFH